MYMHITLEKYIPTFYDCEVIAGIYPERKFKYYIRQYQKNLSTLALLKLLKTILELLELLLKKCITTITSYETLGQY